MVGQMDVDTNEVIAMQLGLGKVETEMLNVQKVLGELDKKIDRLPTTPAIKNMVMENVQKHEDKKHRALDLRTIITSIVVIGTAIGTIYLQLKGV